MVPFPHLTELHRQYYHYKYSSKYVLSMVPPPQCYATIISKTISIIEHTQNSSNSIEHTHNSSNSIEHTHNSNNSIEHTHNSNNSIEHTRSISRGQLNVEKWWFWGNFSRCQMAGITLVGGGFAL